MMQKENRIRAIKGKLDGIPKDRAINLIVLYSGGFDSTALLNMAIRTKKENENVQKVYALYVKSNMLNTGKVELEEKYTEKFISYINKNNNNVEFLKITQDAPDLEEYAKYAENAYDLIFINAIHSVAPFIGSAELNIVLDGTLDKDSRNYHIPFYKRTVESFNLYFRTVDLWMEFPLLYTDKPRIISYLLSEGLYDYCTCCEDPNKDEFCYSCKDHTNALIELLMEYNIYGGIVPNDGDIEFVKKELSRILGGEWN